MSDLPTTEAPPDLGASFRIRPPTPANLAWFAHHLDKGGLVAIPTETVYGLAANARDPRACRRIFSLKGRPLLDPLIVHLSNADQIAELAEPVPGLQTLAEHCWPGPLTIVLPKKPVVDDLLTAGRPTVAIRLPAHPVARDLLTRCGGPLAAPSANPFGYLSPTKPQHVTASFGTDSPWVIDGGECDIGLESTILDLSKPHSPVILRPGHFTASDLSAILDQPVRQQKTVLPDHTAAPAPGTFARHYSPHTPLRLFAGNPPPGPAADKTARVLLQRPQQAHPGTFWLSENGDLAEAARHLYHVLRHLDQAGYARIECQLPPAGGGMADALRDRLHRAAAR